MLNEAALDHEYIVSEAQKRGLRAYVVGENGLVWDQRFAVVASFNWLIMKGGHVGADGTPKGPDNRRVGPSRFLLVVVLRDTVTGIVFFISTKHDIAKADTQYKWRRGLRALGWKWTGFRLAGIVKKYPSGILSGDTNTMGVQNLPGVADVEVPTPGTYGRRRYDRITRFGSTSVSNIHTWVSKSDHKGVAGTFAVSGDGSGTTTPPPAVPPAAKPRPTPKPAPGTPGVNWRKYGAPTAHPWVRRTAQWKRHHPILWRRIARWQKKYRS